MKPFSVRTVRTIRTDRRIFQSFPYSHKLTLSRIGKLYSRSVNHFHEPYGSYDPWSHFQFVRSVRSVRIDKFFKASLSHKLTLSRIEKLYSRSVNHFHESYGSYDPWSHFQFARSVRSVRIDEFSLSLIEKLYSRSVNIFTNRTVRTVREASFTICTTRIRFTVLDNHQMSKLFS